MSTNVASIHIQPTHVAEFWHNTREKETKNSIADTSKNFYSVDAKTAFMMYRGDIEEKTNLYYKKHKRKLPKNTKTLFSAVLNLKENNTVEDVKRVAEYLEKKLGVKVYQISIHEDEGHIEDGKFIKNRHAHILFSGLDEEGRAIKRNKLHIHFLRQLQDDVAGILQMERGEKRAIGERKRLDTYMYKNAVQLANKELEKVERKIKLDDKKIQKYTKLFSKALDKYVGMFNKVKKEDVLNLFVKFLKQFKQKIELLEEENTKLKTIASKKNFENAELKAELAKLKEENAKLLKENLKARKTIKEVKQLNAVKLLEENKELKLTVKNLQAEISNLRKQMIEINKRLKEQEQQNLFSQEDYKYLSKLKKELKKDTIKEIYTEFIKFKQQITKKAQSRDLEL